MGKVKFLIKNIDGLRQTHPFNGHSSLKYSLNKKPIEHLVCSWTKYHAKDWEFKMHSLPPSFLEPRMGGGCSTQPRNYSRLQVEPKSKYKDWASGVQRSMLAPLPVVWGYFTVMEACKWGWQWGAVFQASALAFCCRHEYITLSTWAPGIRNVVGDNLLDNMFYIHWEQWLCSRTVGPESQWPKACLNVCLRAGSWSQSPISSFFSKTLLKKMAG